MIKSRNKIRWESGQLIKTEINAQIHSVDQPTSPDCGVDFNDIISPPAKNAP